MLQEKGRGGTSEHLRTCKGQGVKLVPWGGVRTVKAFEQEQIRLTIWNVHFGHRTTAG